jgi:predicted ATP-dependent protease
MAITIKEVELAIEALEQPGAHLAMLPKSNAIDVLKRSGRLQGRNLEEVHVWPIQMILARLSVLYTELTS